MDKDIRYEVSRKRIHYIGLSVPILYYFTDKPVMLVITGVALIFFLLIDYLRLYTDNKLVHYFFEKENHRTSIKFKGFDKKEHKKEITVPTLGPLLRSKEKRGLGAHTYYALGAFLCILFYDKDIAITATALLVIGDSVAAIAGKKFGRHIIHKKKTFEGSSACFCACLIVAYLLISLPLAIIGACSVTLTELYTTKLNDNFTIPVISGFILTIAAYYV